MVSHLYNISFIFLTSPFMVDFIVYIRVIRVIRSSYHPLFSFVIMSFCLQKSLCLRPSLCYSVSKNHLSLSVSMLFCLKKIICLHLSLCHSVFKKIICLHLSLCHSVFKKIICLHPSLCYSVSKTSSVFICPYVTLSLIYSVCIVLKSFDNDAH